MTTHRPDFTIHPEDEQLFAQLASLQEMHDQLFHLRALPQTVMRPIIDILRFQTAPEDPDGTSKLYENVRKVAVDGLRDVETFKQSWLSEDSQTLRKRAQHEYNPQGTDVWRTDYISALKASKSRELHRTPDVEIQDTRDLKDVIAAFRNQYPQIDIASEDSAGIFPLDIKIDGFNFRIVLANKAEYGVQSKHHAKPSRLRDEILRQLNERRSKGNLEYLLNMIGSYESLMSRPCDSCQMLVNKKLAMPVVRTQRYRTNQQGEGVVEWKAFHVDCI